MKTKLAKLAITAALLAALSATAETDVIEVPTGAEVQCPYAAKVVGVRVHSSVASGTATVKAVSSYEAMGLETNVVETATNYTYTVVSTQLVDSVWTSVTNTTPFDPSPWGTANWTSFATNRVVTLSTNVTAYVASRVVSTNALTASVTCSGGTGTGAAGSFPWIAPGEPIFIEGTARGRAQLFVES